MFNGGRIFKAVLQDLDRIHNPEKWLKIDRKEKLKKLKRKENLNKIRLFFSNIFVLW